MEGPENKAVEAVIDNGSYGKRTLRFETGRLAQQADGAVAAYLADDSMVLSTPTAGSSPKECTPRARSRARSTAAKAVRERRPFSRAASSTARCARCTRTRCAMRCRLWRRCSPSIPTIRTT